MAYVTTRTHYLEINSVPLSTPAWWITNLGTELEGVAVRGSSQQLWRATGRRRRRRYVDERILQFEIVVRGLVKWDGTAYTNAEDGYLANCRELRTNLGVGSSSAVTATYHPTSGSTVAASVDIEHLQFSDLGTHRDGKGVLEICVPAGVFA